LAGAGDRGCGLADFGDFSRFENVVPLLPRRLRLLIFFCGKPRIRGFLFLTASGFAFILMTDFLKYQWPRKKENALRVTFLVDMSRNWGGRCRTCRKVWWWPKADRDFGEEMAARPICPVCGNFLTGADFAIGYPDIKTTRQEVGLN